MSPSPFALRPSLRRDRRRLYLTSGRDASACIWDMLTKVQSGECAMGDCKIGTCEDVEGGSARECEVARGSVGEHRGGARVCKGM